MNKKNILFAVVIVAIAGSIWYLEAMKAGPAAAGPSSGGQTINIEAGASSSAVAALAAADRAAGYRPAMEIVDPTGFVNATSGFRLSNLIGKQVILLDFWTYSCINCIRTLPYVTSWYSKYRNEGLEIVGIHTPEFDFEKNIDNVRAATIQYGIQYPVVLDSDYGTWQAYGNLYWPHEYLIDLAGYIVHDQIGEGNYAETEAEIQKLLAQRDSILGLPDDVSGGTVDPTAVAPGQVGSEETYFGSNRNQPLANGTPGVTGVQNFTLPQTPSANALYLGGTWDIEPEYATNRGAGAVVEFRYYAGKVYFVASAAASTTVQVLQDGKPLPDADAGSDVHGGVLTVGASRLYNVVDDPDGTGEHTLELIVNSPGLQAFTFTFG